MGSFVTPLTTAIGPVSMMLSANQDDWNTVWEESYSRGEIWITAIYFIVEGFATYYAFLQNWTHAILYYDEVL